MLTKTVWAPIRRSEDGEFFLLSECYLQRDLAERVPQAAAYGEAYEAANPIVRVAKFVITERGR